MIEQNELIKNMYVVVFFSAYLVNFVLEKISNNFFCRNILSLEKMKFLERKKVIAFFDNKYLFSFNRLTIRHVYDVFWYLDLSF